jgi:glycosyltransferase involved in cell wall biosynthesis
MKVGLLELSQSFMDYGSVGAKFYGYPYYLYQNMKTNDLGIDVEKIGIYKNKILGKGLSIFFGSMFKNVGGYDIIHNLDLNPFYPAKKGNAATVTTAHDFQFVLRPELSKDVTGELKGRIWLNLVTKMGLKSTLDSDYIIAVSTLTKNDAVALGYPRNRIFVVNHGLSEDFIRDNPHKKGKNKKIVVGYLGAMRVRKNPKMLLDAFGHIEGNKFELQMWGKLGYERDRLLSYASMDRRIQFKGFAPEDRLASIYDSFDVFVYPSLYEGFGIPILEAQARGLPVVIYKGGNIPKEVRRYCFEAKSTEHMAQIIEELGVNGYNERESKRATDYARGFTWERCAEATMRAYQTIQEQNT